MVGAAGSDFSARQGIASESFSEWQAVHFAYARHRRTGQGVGGRHQTTTWLGEMKEVNDV